MKSKHFEEGLFESDPDLNQIFEKEYARQRDHLELIASENYTSWSVLQAMSSIATNKYAEGYPGKRYYGGCEYVDEIENLARDRAKELFGVGDFVPHVNVQSHSGAQANQAVFLALLNPGDRFLACELSHGGHLTHGHPVNLSGKWFEAHQYGVDRETEMLNFDLIRQKAKEVQPKLIIAGYSAYPRTIDFKAFREIADEVGALLMVDMAHISGLVASGEHPSPFPHAHVVTSTTHKTLRGPRSGMIMCQPEFAKKIDSGVFPGLQGGPLMHVIAAKAIMFREALEKEFKDYCANVVTNTKVLGMALNDYSFRLCTGGTDNHLLLLDLRGKGVSGKDAEIALDKAGINTNRNTIPFDEASPFVTSGLRVGTAAMTTRGMGEEEMKKIASWMNEAIEARSSNDRLSEIKKSVKELCEQFPIYPTAFSRK